MNSPSPAGFPRFVPDHQLVTSARESRRAGGSQRIPEPASRRPAGLPVWATREVDFSVDSVSAAVARHQEALGSVSSPRTDERVSAVLIALAHGDAGAEVLLTRRTEHLSNHKGEISFPGGRVDADEGIVEAALREAHEEVGLHPSGVRVVGKLSPLSTFVSKSYIVPVVAMLTDRPELELNTHEVDRAMWVPLTELVRDDTFSWEWWSFDSIDPGTERPMFFFHLDDETVWGATARMLHELLAVVHGANPLDLPNW